MGRTRGGRELRQKKGGDKKPVIAQLDDPHVAAGIDSSYFQRAGFQLLPKLLVEPKAARKLLFGPVATVKPEGGRAIYDVDGIPNAHQRAPQFADKRNPGIRGALLVIRSRKPKLMAGIL